jgi:integrase
MIVKVTLRHKAIGKGRRSLYLDYYPAIPHPDTGKLTRREYLRLHLFEKPKNPLERDHNKETQALALSICTERQRQVINKQFGFLSNTQYKTTLADYYQELAAKRSGTNSDNWHSSLHYLNQFFDEGIKLTELTPQLCNDYREYLMTAPSQRSAKAKGKIKSNSKPELISRNTAVSYFNKFKATLKQAYRDALISTDLNAQVQSIKPSETQRQYLTLEELQTLYSTPCTISILKQAAIFSALTGLRFSDIQKLTWSEIQHSKTGGYNLQFRQQKTKGFEVLPVSDQAVTLLGEPGSPTAKVFKDLEYSAHINSHLKAWIQTAGIDKKITFHCFRHTYATLQLSLGTDIYTVSKMLGHRELKTTQVYAKVIDKAKQEAAQKIKLEL